MNSKIEAFTWEVLLPQRCSTSFGTAAKQRATLAITTDSHGEEHLMLPLTVGKALKSKRDSEEFHPDSRAELMYEVREVSRRCASQRVERLVDKRDYSISELDQKLLQDGYSATVRSQVVGRAQECGLVSDDRYAAAFIRSKLASGWGTLKIEHELRRHGIELQQVHGWPESFLEEESEDDRAYQVASTRRLSNKNGFEKLVRYLTSRGFTMSCAMRVARRVVDERSEGQ